MTKNSFVAKVTFHVLIILFISLFACGSTSILKSILAFGKSEVSLSFVEQFCKDNTSGNYVSSFRIVEFKSPNHLRGASYVT